jgi:uncharacterized phage protein gp47/JayE
MAVELKLFPEILNRMVATVRAESDITDFNVGSVVRSILEAAALQDADQHVQLARLEDLFSIDLASGADLDKRAKDYSGLVAPRYSAAQSAGFVTVGDTTVTRKKSGLLTSSIAIGAATLLVTPDTGMLFADFPATGKLIIERESGLRESVTYTSKTGPNQFNLATYPIYAHAAGVTLILSQQGVDRLVPPLTKVSVPATVDSSQIDFETTASATFYDGEASVVAPVRSKLPGFDKNVADGYISTFASLPFPTATVTNTSTLAGGRDRETDDEFRARIKNTVATWNGGTKPAIEAAAAKVKLASGQRVVSAQLVEPVMPGDPSVLYIDDGAGFIPPTIRVDTPEVIIQKAEPGQSRGKVVNYPILDGTLRIFRSILSGAQTAGVPTITVVGNTLTHAGAVFASSLAATPHFLVDSNKNVFKIMGATGGSSVDLDGPPVTPIAGENYFIVDLNGTNVLDQESLSVDYTTGNIQFLGIALSSVPNNNAEGVIAMRENYPNLPIVGAPAYQYYGGLIQEVQRVVNGVPSDPYNYPGVKGAGARVQVTTPQILNVVLSLGITAPPGVAEETLYTPIKRAIMGYVNNLGIGDDVVVSEIIRIAQENGAADTRMISPTSNRIVLDGELARTSLALITIS